MIILPGWNCQLCGVFNGTEKSRTGCRICETTKQASNQMQLIGELAEGSIKVSVIEGGQVHLFLWSQRMSLTLIPDDAAQLSELLRIAADTAQATGE